MTETEHDDRASAAETGDEGTLGGDAPRGDSARQAAERFEPLPEAIDAEAEAAEPAEGSHPGFPADRSGDDSGVASAGQEAAPSPGAAAADREARPSPEVGAGRTAGSETDEAAEVVERAEAGDDAAAVALEAAGGPAGDPAEGDEQAEPVSEERSSEALNHLEESAADRPLEDRDADLTDVPTEEATTYESEAESSLASDAVEGEDEGPLLATGPDTYVQDEDGARREERPVPESGRAEAAGAPAARGQTTPSVGRGPDGPVATSKSNGGSATRVEEAEEEDRPRDLLGGPGDWYVIHTYAGYENKVKANLESRIQTMQMEDKIFNVVIPMEDVMEIKGGKKQVVQKKVFPGYLLVKMVYDNDSWYVVRNTPGVTGFVSSGTGTKPTPLSTREVEKILAVKQETKVKPQYRLEWEEGDVVRIVAGPFADFTGTIAEINVEQSKLKVMVNIFDRETPVELAFDQVAKA